MGKPRADDSGVNLDQLDFQLLRCLQVLVKERHITRAASRLDIPQSTLSGALARLRTLIGDPLLIKEGSEMVPTQTAVDLADQSAMFIGEMYATLSARRTFDARTARATIRVLGTDYTTYGIFKNLIITLRRESPEIQIRAVVASNRDLGHALKRGEADLALTYGYSLPDDLVVTTLFRLPYSCIVSANHPAAADTLDLSHYVAFGHVVAIFNDGGILAFERELDQALAARGLARTHAVQVQTIIAIPHIVADTDLIATVPTDLALDMARHLPLRVFPLPLSIPKPQFTIAWHRRSNMDPVHEWVRSKLIKSARSLVSR